MRQISTLALAAFILSGCVVNQNVPLPYSIAEALDSRGYKDKQAYKERLTGVRFFFGNQSHPAVEKSFGVAKSTQRSSTVERESKESCARAFATVLLQLRKAAFKNGGDAVINIKSAYKGNEVSSETSYQCATGVLMSGVALQGTVVKLRN